MEDIKNGIKRFFRTYEKNANINDVEAVATQFAEVFMLADPGGLRAIPAKELLAGIPQRKKMFESIGCQATTLVAMEQTKLSDQYYLVKTEWSMQIECGTDRFRKIPLHSTFIVFGSGEDLKIAFYLPHEDLMSVLRKHGVSPPS
ncbi:MAG: hypothetical protein M3Y50_05320 [Acidobacteriota bacterium]|nr:hypothetical protein [Acidobacteriota bacterium]